MKIMKNKRIFSVGLLGLILFAPSLARAKNLGDLIGDMTDLVGGSVITLIFAIALAYFFWGVVQYTIAQTQESKDKGRGYMIWGLIALTVMFSVYGLIRILRNTFSVTENQAEPLPKLPQ